MAPHTEKIMNIIYFKRIIDELNDNKIFFISIAGGEPFVHPDIEEMIEYVKSKNINMSILSNGIDVKDSTIHLMENIKDKMHVQISLDSVCDEVNIKTRGVDSKGVIQNILKIAKTGVRLSIGIVVTKYNYMTVQETINKMTPFGKNFNIMDLQNTPFEKELSNEHGIKYNEFTTLELELKKLRKNKNIQISLPEDLANSNNCIAKGSPCAACFTYLVIDPDLRVRPCDRVTNAYIGSLQCNSIKEIWNSANALDVVNRKMPLCIN